MTEKKPDLSDLKARLGLTKPGAAPPGVTPPPGAAQAPTPTAPVPPAAPASNPSGFARPPASAPQVSAPAPASTPQAHTQAHPTAAAHPQAPPAAAAHRTAAAPPAGASVPPTQARAPKARDAVPMAAAPLDIDIHSMDTAPAFSKGMLVIFVACFVGGLVFGYAASNTMFQREISQARVADATELRESFGKKISAFNEALTKIMALNEMNVDFSAAEALSKIEFATGGNELAKNRLLLGQVAIDNVTSYTIDSKLLAAMLAEHNRLTNTVDKEELDQIAAENKILENDWFGVVFDYKHALQNGGAVDYTPKEGTLIIFQGKNEETGKAKIEYPTTGNQAEVDMAGLIPIGKSQIVKSGGQNALTRYQWRVRQIKFQADKISKYTDAVLASLDAVAAE